MEKYTFKEITSKEQLEIFFRLRYEIYSNSDNKNFIQEISEQIDIDYYDIRARHYAITCGEKKAGYLRVIHPKNEFTNMLVLEIGKDHKLLNEEEYYQKNEEAPFPFLSYEGVPKSHWEYYHDLLKRGEHVNETGRLILHPDFRTIKTSKFLIESAMAQSILISIEQKYTMIINCAVEHSLFYKRYGFKEIDKNGCYSVNGLNKVSLSGSISLSSVPQYLHEKFGEMAQEFKETNKIEREL